MFNLCSDWLDINHDPNTAEKVDPGYLFKSYNVNLTLNPKLLVEGMLLNSTPPPIREGPKKLASGSICGT